MFIKAISYYFSFSLSSLSCVLVGSVVVYLSVFRLVCLSQSQSVFTVQDVRRMLLNSGGLNQVQVELFIEVSDFIFLSFGGSCFCCCYSLVGAV